MAQTKAGALKIAAGKAGYAPDEYAARVDAGEKWCYKCRAWKPRAAYVRDRSRSDGLTATCTACRNRRVRPGPTLPERRAKRAAGEAWCRGCRAWLPLPDMRAGLCRPCTNADARWRYASDPDFRAERRQHAHARRRNVAPIPPIGQAILLDEFGGECAYCPAAATTWDHLVAVADGGETVPGNIVPACGPCNFRKKNRNLNDFLVTVPLHKKAHLEARLILYWTGPTA